MEEIKYVPFTWLADQIAEKDETTFEEYLEDCEFDEEDAEYFKYSQYYSYLDEDEEDEDEEEEQDLDFDQYYTSNKNKENNGNINLKNPGFLGLFK